MKSTSLFRTLSVMLFSCMIALPVMAQKKGQKKTTFRVEIDCQGCVNTIEKNIPWEKGVTDLKCDMKTQTVEVTYKTSRTNDSTLIAAFKKIGKEAVVVPEGTKIEPIESCKDHNHGDDHKH